MKEKEKVNVDYIGQGGKAQGDVATHAMAGGALDVNSMKPFIAEDGRAYVTYFKGGNPKKPQSYGTRPVTNATLRRDEWKHLDEALLQLAEERLGGVQDLIDNGLVYNIGSGMGSTVLEYHDVSDALEADLTMDGITRALGDRPDFTTVYLPLPIIHADYEINARVLAASRSLGAPLDTTLAKRAGRKILEKLEKMLFQNETYAFGGGTIYSYLNHPDRNLITLSTYGVWDDDSATTALEIIECVKAMKQASIDAHYYGPWMLYIPTNYEVRLDNDYDMTTPGTTIRERILKIAGIKGIKVVDYLHNSEDSLDADNVLLVCMQPDVVRLVQGMGIQNVQWQEEGKMVTKYKVMTIQVPQIRSDQEGHSGIVHASG